MRTFIAVELTTELQQKLETSGQKLAAQLSAAGLEAAMRWTSTANYHLTLRFLGDTTDEQARALVPGLAEAAARWSPFALNLQGLGAFPHWRAPRVVWVGIDGQGKTLQRLQEQVEEVVQGCDFAPEQRPFHPHITLARAARHADRQTIRQAGTLLAAQAASATSLGRWKVSELVWMRSELRPAGPVYTVLERFGLAAAPAK